jgi:hypothetical protein
MSRGGCAASGNLSLTEFFSPPHRPQTAELLLSNYCRTRFCDGWWLPGQENLVSRHFAWFFK